MKRKVQAQRKFAQGAYIPPLSTNNSTSKSDVPAPIKEERRSAIVHSNLSARNLLDIVSFQSMHTHSEPVVLLERMTPKENSLPTTNGNDVLKPSAPQAVPVRAKLRRLALVGSGDMSLRSRKNKPVHKREAPHHTHASRKMRKTKTELKMRLKKVWARVTSTSDLEDDRPLKYLKHPEVPLGGEGRMTRSSLDRATPLSVSDGRQTRASMISERTTSTNDLEKEPEEEVEGRVTRSSTSMQERSEAREEFEGRVTRSSTSMSLAEMKEEIEGKATRPSTSMSLAEFESEDETPELKHSVPLPEMEEENIGRTTRSSSQLELEDEDEGAKRSASRIELEEEVEGRVTRSSSNFDKKRSCDVLSVCRPPKEARTSAFKEPAVPTRFNRTGNEQQRRPVPVASVDPTMHMPEPIATTSQEAVSSTSQEPIYITSQEPVAFTSQAPVPSTSEEPIPSTSQEPQYANHIHQHSAFVPTGQGLPENISSDQVHQPSAFVPTSQGPPGNMPPDYILQPCAFVPCQGPPEYMPPDHVLPPCAYAPTSQATPENMPPDHIYRPCAFVPVSQGPPGNMHPGPIHRPAAFVPTSQGPPGNMPPGHAVHAPVFIPTCQATSVSMPPGHILQPPVFIPTCQAPPMNMPPGHIHPAPVFVPTCQPPPGTMAPDHIRQPVFIPTCQAPPGYAADYMSECYTYVHPMQGPYPYYAEVHPPCAYGPHIHGPRFMPDHVHQRCPLTPRGPGVHIVRIHPDQIRRFYDNRGIECWMTHCCNAQDGSHEPYRPRAPSPCPSECLRTVKDVMSATADAMAKRCQNCKCCDRVRLVEQISSLINRTLRPGDPGRSNDIYQFDANDDDSHPLPFYVHRKRTPNQGRDSNASNSEDEQRLYLDLQKDSPHIIEMTSVLMPNTNKRIMKAKLIPKSEAHATSDFSLVEHENLLDQLLQTLIVNQNGNEETQAQVDNTPQPSTSAAPQPSTSAVPQPSTSVEPQPSTSGVSRPSKKSQAARNESQRPSTSYSPQPSTSSTPQPTPAETRRSERLDQTVKPSRRVNTRANDEQAKSKPDASRPNVSKPNAPKPNAPKPDAPKPEKTAKMLEAPTFYPTEEEFNDPIAYIEKIAPSASKYGLCKIVAPDSFKPKCILDDDLKFNVHNHYIARLFSRWGPAAREISAMRAYLATQNINFSRVPLLESLEVNLPKLYSVVQRNGGLKTVMEKKRWGRVAEEMRFSKGPNVEKLLDSYYVKYMLPYDTASNQERTKIMTAVERCWNKKHKKLVQWARNPLHHQKKLLGESDSSEEEAADDSMERALHEAEECVVAGRPMNLTTFKKVAAHAMAIYMGNPKATVEEIEKEYWRLVLFGTEHVCVNAASIDTTASGYGFPKSRTDDGGKHPWNLKMLSNNTNNLLRSLSGVVGVTVPTLHLGMVFSTYCWHRDPHGLPWIEYVHQGPPKIWYGIPEEQSDNFRAAVEALCPTSCQNKYIWLSSDITMIPPKLLLEHKVTLSHTQQNPGEFIIVFPKAYSCSISTGFTVSESVYFATNSWLKTVHEVFRELRASCEPATFTLEQLLLALARDPRSSFGVLHTAHSSLSTIVHEELRLRTELAGKGLPMRSRNLSRQRNGAAWNVREEAECQICRCTLYLSKVTGVLSKKSELCLLHAHRMLETRSYSKSEIAKMETVLFFTEKQLHEIMTNLKKRLTS